MSKTKFGVALLGCGTVGRGVYDLLQRQVRDIEQKYGFEFAIRKILVRDAKKQRDGFNVGPGVLTANFSDILGDDNIDILIEVMGGVDPAKEYITDFLKSGRPAITANKELMGKCGDKLVEKARQQGVFLGFSAAVTGFHQFVPSMVKSIAITELMGIFNGTTNFILSKLAEKSFDEALGEAIKLGYAEADHKNDTDGHDTRNKLVVATKLAFGVLLPWEEISVEGISKITKEDIAYADRLGYAIKLVGISRIVEADKLAAFVAPALIPKEDPLASVNGVNNAILVNDKIRGIQGMSAPGAGKAATAMAIFNDLISIARGEKTLWEEASLSRRNLKFTRSQIPACFYVRFDVQNQPGSLSNITKEFARNDVNIIRIDQPESANPQIASIIFMLEQTKQKSLEKMVNELLDAKVASKAVILRVETLKPISTDTTVADTSDRIPRSDLIPA